MLYLALASNSIEQIPYAMELQPEHRFQFPQEKTTYRVVQWDEFVALSQAAALRVLADDKQFDVIVALAKGGWPIGRIFADVLGVRRGLSLGLQTYTGIDTHAEPKIYQEIAAESVAGKNVLITDDVADSGVSLQFAVQYLLTLGAAEVTTATCFYKPHSQVVPDFYGAETSDWIIFPFEACETVALLQKRWLAAGVSSEEVMRRFEQFELNSQLVAAAE